MKEFLLFLLKSSGMKCVTLSCAKFIVPGELFVLGLRLGNINGQSRLRLVFCILLCDRTHKGECRTKVFFVTESKVDISIRLYS